MYLQSPIFPLIVAVITLYMTIINSIQSEKITKNLLSFSAFNFIVAAIALLIYDKYIEPKDLYLKIYSYYSLFVYLYFFIIFNITLRRANLKANHYQLFVKSIRESNWNAYYIVDRKERVKDISSSMLDELGIEKSEIVGKKLFSVLNKTVRFQQLNGGEISNKQLEHYYNNYKKEAKLGDSEVQELVMLNFEGEQVIFKLILQPVFVMGKYRGRIVVGEKKSDFDLLGVEKKLSKSEQTLESIRLKFISTLEISKEGLFSIDLDEKSIWASSALIKILNLPSSEMNLSDFRSLIHPDDLTSYVTAIGDLSLTKQHYQIRYRILKDGSYMWVEERGKRIFDDHYTTTIMGTLNPVSVKHFRASNIDVLDQLEGYHELLVKMNGLINKDHYFYLMLINLNNIPNINEEHGWDVGNMIIADYITKMRNTFITENGEIYRISGLKFAILVTNPNKMDILNKGIRQNPQMLDLDVKYGSINTKLKVFAGISISKEDFVVEEKLYQAAEEALKIAKNDKVTHRGIFYKDIKKWPKNKLEY